MTTDHDARMAARRWRWRLRFRMWSVGIEQEVLSDGKWRDGIGHYIIGVARPWQFGFFHGYYDGCIHALWLGFLYLNWAPEWCCRCMPCGCAECPTCKGKQP